MTTNQPSAIVIQARDNVATATKAIRAGDIIMVKVGDIERKVTLRDDVGFLYKFALSDINKGEHVIKYGQVIGEATRYIHTG